ncbi:hypothetical protein [Spirosoma litoris]
MKQRIQNSQPARFQIIKKHITTRQTTAQPAPVRNVSGSTIDVTSLI